MYIISIQYTNYTHWIHIKDVLIGFVLFHNYLSELPMAQGFFFFHCHHCYPIEAPVSSGPSMAPLLAMIAVLGLRATGAPCRCSMGGGWRDDLAIFYRNTHRKTIGT